MKFNISAATFVSIPVTATLVAMIFAFSMCSFFNRSFFYKLVLHPYDIWRNGNYYRIFSADLAHIDIQHFVVNEVSLFFIGGNLERHLRHLSNLGSFQFAVIFFGSLLTGNLMMLTIYRNDIKFSTAGASGSIMGCVFGFMYLEPTTTAFYLPVIGSVSNEYYVLIYIASMVLLKKRLKNSQVNFELHFWGALGGLLTTILVINL